MVGHQACTAFTHDTVFFLRTGHDTLDGVTDLVIADFRQLAASRQDCGLIQEIGKVSTRISGSPARDLVEVDVLRQSFASGMDTQDLETPGIIRAINGDLTVEATWAHECGVQHIGPVGGSNNDDAGVALKTIHLSQELVESLFPFVVTTA